MINWKVRIKNPTFWISAIAALALVVQSVAELFGYTIDMSTMVGKLQMVVKYVFGFLAIMGIVNDPTTSGVSDSERAMGYEVPWKDDPPQEDGGEGE